MKVFSILDIKAKTYCKPFVDTTPASAIRSFGQAVNDPQSQISKFPEDYILYQIGEFSETTGALKPTERTELAQAHNLVEEKETPPLLAAMAG